jgi:FSR family fosmidomycin resistance protein-like MFS transporter
VHSPTFELRMATNTSKDHQVRTLWLCGTLHAFTHIYHVALMPLYLLIQRDLMLASVEHATLLLTLMMLAYFLPSYGMGVLADRLSRKKLLAAGLAINGLGYVGLAFAHNYAWAVVCVMIAGLGGSFFHPAATSMIARLFPANTGRALGLIGVGASVGFFIGPLYSGWRADSAGWRAPVLELGSAGVLMAGLFAWLAQEEPARIQANERKIVREKLFATPALCLLFIAMSFAFGLRDFTGSSMGSLGSLFLQNASGFDLKQTGMALSAIFLASVVSNPLFGHLSDHRGRIRWTCMVLLISVVVVGILPRVPAQWLIPTFALYGFFFMASYPMVEAGLMEAVPEAVRGRAFGFFITLAGLIGNLSHWMAGNWVKSLGNNAHSPHAYYPLYRQLSLLLLLSLLGLPFLHAIRKREKPAPEASPDPVAGTVRDPQFE